MASAPAVAVLHSRQGVCTLDSQGNFLFLVERTEGRLSRRYMAVFSCTCMVSRWPSRLAVALLIFSTPVATQQTSEPSEGRSTPSALFKKVIDNQEHGEKVLDQFERTQRDEALPPAAGDPRPAVTKVWRVFPTGAGVDNIDYDEDSGLLYAAAGDAAQLTIARVSDTGRPTITALVPTTRGARSVVAGPNGCAYLIDPVGGRILRVEPK